MKVHQILEARDEHQKRWADSDIDVLYNEVKKTTMSKEEVRDLSKQLAQQHDLGRTAVGIYQILIQLHMMVHGVFPEGIIVYEGNWQNVTNTIKKFAKAHGHDAEVNYDNAISNMKKRVAATKAKVNEPAARKAMSDYYKANKNILVNPKKITPNREKIKKEIMDGKSPEEAFNPYRKAK